MRETQERNAAHDPAIGFPADGSAGTHIRLAKVCDLAAIATCSNLAFAPYSATSDDGAGDIQFAKSLHSQILEGAIHLICEGAEVLGYIAFWPAADRMFVDTLAVLPKHHRRGLGSQLLAFADLETQRLGLEGISLFTKTKMTGNLRFYQRRGYRETDRCDDDGFCRVFYTKMLPPLAVAAYAARTPF